MSGFPHSFDAVLFDMDGTILNSIEATERVWMAWALRRGLDPVAFLPTIHGVRAIETIRRLNLAGVDAEVEAVLLAEAEMADVEGIVAIDGVAGFLAALPAEKWAVVTSAPRRLALRRIAAAGLPAPPLLITAEDVARGKPAPDCFVLAAERLGTRPKRCVVFEDAPAGIAAAEAAGCSVVIMTATHRHAMETSHRTLPDYTGLLLRDAEGGMQFSVAAG